MVSFYPSVFKKLPEPLKNDKMENWNKEKEEANMLPTRVVSLTASLSLMLTRKKGKI